MRKLTKERHERIRKFLEEENWSDVDVQWLEDALHDLDEADREYETLYEVLAHGDEEHRLWLKEVLEAHRDGKPVPQVYGSGRKEKEIVELRATLSETERRLAEAETLLAKNSLYRVWKKRIEEMVSLQEKLAEAETKASAAEAERIAALMCLGELEALRGEAEKLREVERAARILMDVTRDGDEELVKADMRALNTTLAAVDALRKKEATPND